MGRLFATLLTLTFLGSHAAHRRLNNPFEDNTPPLLSSHPSRRRMTNPFEDNEPHCDFPTYSLEEWRAINGDKLPDHPALFKAHGAAPPAMSKYSNFTAILSTFGEEILDTEPGYAQAGGHLVLLWPKSRVGWKSRLDKLAAAWNSSKLGWYHSEFNCGVGSKMCKRIHSDMGRMIPFGNVGGHRVNFLVGGPGSGLPFHRHSATWQTLVNGRKAWFVVPPVHMGDALADVVGPYLYPPDAWDNRVRGKPLGERPLRCVQYPGDQLYLPKMWWHATMNLDENVAYGLRPALTGREIEKSGWPGNEQQQQRSGGPIDDSSPSLAQQRLVAPFTPDPAPSIIFLDNNSTRSNSATGSNATASPRWFDLIELQAWTAAHPKNALAGYSGVLRRVRAAVALAVVADDAALMRQTAAFMHCHLRSQMQRFAFEHPEVRSEETLGRTLAQWGDYARGYSPEIHARQCFDLAKEGTRRTGGVWEGASSLSASGGRSLSLY